MELFVSKRVGTLDLTTVRVEVQCVLHIITVG